MSLLKTSSPGDVQFREVIQGRGLVVVVVVNMGGLVAVEVLSKEVHELFEGNPFAPAIERPEGAVPGTAMPIYVRRVGNAKQVLEAELLAVLGVVTRALDVEEQVALGGFGQAQ